MFKVTAKVAKELSWQRLILEIRMCQDLCMIMDEKLGAYMTLFGRMAVLNMISRLEELPEPHKKKVYSEWMKDAQYYAPWTLWSDMRPQRLNDFLDRDTTLFLAPQYPWGVLTLGGLMRAYAEMSELIHKHVKIKPRPLIHPKKKEKVVDGRGKEVPAFDINGQEKWKYRRISEEEGRLSWQRNLIESYGYDLFKKGQVDKKTEDPQKAIKEYRKGGDPKKDKHDRLRYQRDLIPPEKELKAWDERYKSLEPSWTRAGRVKWQTFPLDRISLVGDVYGLMRGATISGTTSDHAYSFWQLCADVRNVGEDSHMYNYLTRGVATDYSWGAHTAENLKTALKTMKNDVGFGRILRLMMLVPVSQMGIEMHHSVHEMASVIGLNDMINWRVGHYDTLFMTLDELKKLEEKYMKWWREKHTKKTYDDWGRVLKASDKEREVENIIKKMLQTATDLTCHGYFMTIDPHFNSIRNEEWAGVIMENKTEVSKQKKGAIVSQERFETLNSLIKSKEKKYVTNEGITKEYIKQSLISDHKMKQKDGEQLMASESINSVNAAMKRARTKYDVPPVDYVQYINSSIWERYNKAWNEYIKSLRGPKYIS